MPSTPRSRLATRRRKSARLALYASCASVVALTATFIVWVRPAFEGSGATEWARRDFSKHREVELLREYIAIDTETFAGDQLAGAEWVVRQLEDMGLEPVVQRVGDEANVWAVVEGERPEAIVLHHHIDVDPVTHEESWVHPPFAGTIEGPWLYGRGAFDMKSVAVAQLEAVRRLVERGKRPRWSVVVLATTGEETGSDLGTRWVLNTQPELVERFAVVLTEGGTVESTVPGVADFWGTEVGQVRVVKVVVCHASREALVELRKDLRGMDRVSAPRRTPPTDRMMPEYAQSRPFEGLRADLDDLDALLRDPRRFAGLSPYVRSLFVDRMVPLGIHETDGGGWELLVTLLLLPGTDADAALAEFLPDWLLHGFTVDVFDEGAARHGSSPDHPVFQAIDRLVEERHPGLAHGPLYLPQTVTDARFFRRAGIPTFGFSPFNVVTPDVLRTRLRSTVNERIGLAGYVEGVELYRDLLERLAGDEIRRLD